MFIYPYISIKSKPFRGTVPLKTVIYDVCKVKASCQVLCTKYFGAERARLSIMLFCTVSNVTVECFVQMSP
jgi:hypothetical protein